MTDEQRIRFVLVVVVSLALGELAWHHVTPAAAQRETAISSVSSYQELNNITNAAAQTFTATDPAIVDVFASVETASIRWRCDGTAPTATVGILVSPGGTIVLHGHENVRRLSIIATTATNANVHGLLSRP
jgi:hypothetical protein